MQAIDDDIRRSIAEVEGDLMPNRERSLVITKLQEAQLWLTKCEPQL